MNTPPPKQAAAKVSYRDMVNALNGKSTIPPLETGWELVCYWNEAINVAFDAQVTSLGVESPCLNETFAAFALQLMDVVFFLCLSSLFMLAYGISVHAIRFPNTGLTWELMGDVVYMPYWQMYGELSLDEISGQ